MDPYNLLIGLNLLTVMHEKHTNTDPITDSMGNSESTVQGLAGYPVLLFLYLMVRIC